MQLDIFNDSRDVMLRNDVLAALQAYDAPKAQAAWALLRHEYPEDLFLVGSQVLLRALQARDSQHEPDAFTHHADLRTPRLVLLETVTPAAQSLMSEPAAQMWLRPFWQTLIARSQALTFRADDEQDHAAWMLLHMQDWKACMDAVAQIASWRRIPAPLAWMAQSKLQLLGLRAAWPLLAELAWLAPHRLQALVQTTPEPQLQRLADAFELAWDALDEPVAPQDAIHKVAAYAEAERAWAWFPAWVLTAQAQHVADLALAQPGQHKAPEQAMRLLVNLLGLERQGRHHDLVQQRKSLRGLHPGLYAAYMKTR
jgi:hypothetical protein